MTPGRARVARPPSGHPSLATDPEETSPDLEQRDDETPAFDVDLEPEDQGTAEAADEQTA